MTENLLASTHFQSAPPPCSPLPPSPSRASSNTALRAGASVRGPPKQIAPNETLGAICYVILFALPGLLYWPATIIGTKYRSARARQSSQDAGPNYYGGRAGDSIRHKHDRCLIEAIRHSGRVTRLASHQSGLRCWTTGSHRCNRRSARPHRHRQVPENHC